MLVTVYSPLLTFLSRQTLSVKPLQNLPVNKGLEKFWLNSVYCKFFIYVQKSVLTTNFGPFGEIGANFSVQLSSRKQFAKIKNKEVIAKNHCEKHKKLSFAAYQKRPRQTG